MVVEKGPCLDVASRQDGGGVTVVEKKDSKNRYTALGFGNIPRRGLEKMRD